MFDGNMNHYVEWNEIKLSNFLSNKFIGRIPALCELLFLSRFIRKLNPEVIIDVGTWLGITGHILGTSSHKVKHLYSIDNTHNDTFVPYFRGDINRYVKKSEYGMYLPEFAEYIGCGYENILGELISDYDGNVFVFLDAKKRADLVLDEIKICYNNKAQYIGIHDTSKHYKRPRRAMMKSIKDGWYSLICEDITCDKNGVSILKLNGKENKKG